MVGVTVILVHLASSWPAVVRGEKDAAEVTLGNWAGIAEDKLDTYADTILGIYKNEVVTAFDITGWQKLTDGTDAGRVEFIGHPSTRWAHLIGTPNPGRYWTKGMARPIQYVDTADLAHTYPDTAPDDPRQDRRMVVGGYTLTVHADGNATVTAPPGRHVTVSAQARSGEGWQQVDVHDDAVFRSAFEQVHDADWHQLAVLLRRIDEHDGPLYEIAGGADDQGIEQWPYAVDSPVIEDLRWLLRRAGLVLHFNPARWQLRDAATASAEDCVRALSRMVRADNWTTAGFAQCFEEPDSVGRVVLRRALDLAQR